MIFQNSYISRHMRHYINMIWIWDHPYITSAYLWNFLTHPLTMYVIRNMYKDGPYTKYLLNNSWLKLLSEMLILKNLLIRKKSLCKYIIFWSKMFLSFSYFSFYLHFLGRDNRLEIKPGGLGSRIRDMEAELRPKVITDLISVNLL